MTNGSGIDIEPNPGQTVSTVLISRSTFSGNNCLGLSSGVPEASTGSAFVNTIFIDGNTFTANRIRGINISNCSGTVVTSNTCTGNGEYGILLTAGADNAVCTGNRVSGTTGSPGNGIDVDTCTGDTVTGNTSTGNAGHGVYVVASTGCTVSGNTQSGDGIAP
jgi:parallel beta-helix repeat protein